MTFLFKPWKWFIQLIDSDYFPEGASSVREKPDKFEFKHFFPFLILHLGCLGIIWVGWSWTAVIAAILFYVIRMFFVTGVYHRYFCHRAYKTSRPVQFLLALLSLSAAQRGPLWWAAVHRHHHAHSDDEEDVHSPGLQGFWWAHIGWLTSARNYPTNYRLIPDLAKYPELVFLNRFDLIGPFVFAIFVYLLGVFLGHFAPGLGTNGPQMLVWGFFVSTVCVFHATCSINSLTHLVGKRRFKTGDDSRNSFVLAILTLGEGWHNNHHHYQASARQGFYWWEIDITYYVLKLLAACGIIWNLKPVPDAAYQQATAHKMVAHK